jgi:GT2 family glycosyltransferase
MLDKFNCLRLYIGMALVKARDSLSFPAPDGLDVISVEQTQRPTAAPARVVHPDPTFLVTLAPQRAIGGGWYRLTIRFPPEGTVDVIAQLSFSDGEEFWRRLPAFERNHFVASLRCNSPLANIKLMVSGSGHLLRPICVEFRPVNRLSILRALSRVPFIFRQHGLSGIGTILQAGVRLIEPRTLVIAAGPAAASQEEPYDTWMRIFDEVPERDRQRHLERMQTLTQRPVFSVLVTIESFTVSSVDKLIHSLAEQIYPNWELVIAVPQALVVSLKKHLLKMLLRNHVLVTAGDGPATRNDLASMAAGDFLVTVPVDAQLRPNALLEVALTLEAYPEAALVYSDEDQVGVDGKRQNPHFKPAWSPDVFDVFDYLGHLTVMSRKAVTTAGGWKSELGTAADYDLKARIVDRIEPAKIVHLAKILVHVSRSAAVAEPTQRRQIERAIRNHCVRRDVNADIAWPETEPYPRLKYRPEPPPLVSLLIPTRDRANILETCVRSILTRTTYQPYEILIIDNDSREAATHRLFEKLRSESVVRVISSPGPFNFSALNNAAARQAAGAIIGLLNNDLEVVDGGWLDEMVALASRPEVGCVGCKLLYPEGQIQHAGVYLGPGSLAGHGHRYAQRDASGYMDRLRMLQNLSAVTAACLVIRKEVFFKVGGLDEKELKVAYNDVDLCLKVIAAGYRNLCTPFAELIHHESISRGHDYTPAKARRLFSESNALRRRWGSAIFSDPYYSPHLTYDREDFSVRDR